MSENENLEDLPIFDEPILETPVHETVITNASPSRSYQLTRRNLQTGEVEFVKQIEANSCFGFMIEEGYELSLKFAEE